MLHFISFPTQNKMTWIERIVFTAECPYEPYPGVPADFWIKGDELTVISCTEGMEFMNTGDLCDCIPVGESMQFNSVRI